MDFTGGFSSNVSAIRKKPSLLGMVVKIKKRQEVRFEYERDWLFRKRPGFSG